ncbi:hypothetical protein ABZ791_10645 [Streptomyces huasconensis]|uniref:Uncharacterized protein n=1 Tax=Streptomyces huasconensis TaxID=1854574 RepID=A0ABV3M722_9ACTN
MAEAKRTIIEQEVTETKRIPAVSLTLTVEEAETLMAIGCRIAGDRYKSPRRHYESVVRALAKAGVRDFTAAGDHPYKHLTGSGLSFTVAPLKQAGGDWHVSF